MLKGRKIVQEQPEKEDFSTTPGALYPKNDLNSSEIESYKELLDIALEDNRINNIAVTAPYGVGKSTVLESYFKLRRNYYPWYVRSVNWGIKHINKCKKKILFSPNLLNEIKDYEFIILPNFFTNSDDRNELQKKVIEQLLFSSNPKKYPFSKLKRIRDTNWVIDIIISLLFLFIGASLFYLYNKAKGDTNQFNKLISNLNQLDIFLFISTITLVIGCLVWLVRKIRVTLTKSTISGKGTLGPLEIVSNDSDDSSEMNVFNVFSEELLYYFRKSRSKIIVFEDLDRFGKPEIFQELRELNININKRQSKVVFIYSLQDKVFDKIVENEDSEKSVDNKTPDKRVRSKAKFFDFVVPIFPVTSLYNSSKTIENELKKYGLKLGKENNELSKEFIRSMGLFLKDQRMIILIVSEFNSYLKILNLQKKENIDLKVLFSTIVYKNFYAEDFEKIGYGSSLLNKIFDNVHLLYNEHTDAKIKILKNRKIEIEKNISDLKHQLNYDVDGILASNYWKLISKYKGDSNSFDRQYFQVNNRNYNLNAGISFFTDIVELEDSTQIISSNTNYGGRKLFTVKDAFEIGGRSQSLKILAKEHSKEKLTSNLISDLKRERLIIEKKIKDEAARVYSLQTGEILKELIDVYTGDSELKESLNEIKEDNFKRYLFFNNLITPSFYSYISPIEFSENQIDSSFIELVLSYHEISEDYQVVDVENTVKELNSSGANYSYAYSSNLLAYLLADNRYSREKALILDKMIEKKDYQFLDNMLSYSKKNTLDITKGIVLLVVKSKETFIHSFPNLTESNNRFLVENVFKSITELSSQGTERVIEEIFTSLINESSTMGNVIDMLREEKNQKILNEYRDFLKINNISDILIETDNEYNEEMIKFIYIEELYSSNKENIENFGVFLDTELYFDAFTKKFEELELKFLNLELIHEFFKDRYKQGLPESYAGFSEFVDFSLGEHLFYNKFENNPVPNIELEEIKHNLVVFYSKATFEEKRYDLIGEIIEKIGLETQLIGSKIEDSIVVELLEAHKITYSYSLLESIYKNYSIYTVKYLLSVYAVYPNFIEKNIEEFYELIGEEEKLHLIKSITDKEDYAIIGSFLRGENETWIHIHQSNPSFFDNDMIAKILYLENAALHKILLEITSEENQANVFYDYLLKFPKTMSLLEFEELINVDPFLSAISPDARKHHKLNLAISNNLIDVLNKLDVINYTKDSGKIIFKRNVWDFFKR